MANHDHGYKLMFSHPAMVEDLLRGFVPGEWVDELDFSTLEKVNASFVSDHLRAREDDLVWRVRWGARWVYVYLLLEFQSRVDAFMAVRMLGYVALLYQDLVRSGELTGEGRLPPVLPVVLYNGAQRWTAAAEVADLVEPAPHGLGRYAPRMRYLLLDEGRCEVAALGAQRNLVAALFRLERSQEPAAVAEVVGRLIEWLQAPEQRSLQRAFAVWIGRVLLPARAPGAEIPEVHELQEVRSMLAERVKEWTRDWKAQGIVEGRAQGQRLLLRRQLVRRYGQMPDWAERRLERAQPARIEQWADRVLDGGSLADVRGPPTGQPGD